MLFMHTLVNAEIIRLNCKDIKSDYNLMLAINTNANSVLMNESFMSNVSISDSRIYFEMEIVEKSRGDRWTHSINRTTGVLTLQRLPDASMAFFQCSKATVNKF